MFAPSPTIYVGIILNPFTFCQHQVSIYKKNSSLKKKYSQINLEGRYVVHLSSHRLRVRRFATFNSVRGIGGIMDSLVFYIAGHHKDFLIAHL